MIRDVENAMEGQVHRKTEQGTVNTLLTIGYEGATVDDFIATLKSANVDVLIDIREVAISRKPGFSKNALARILGDAGLDYIHLRDLGDPKPGREAARRGDMESFQNIFRAHMECDMTQKALGMAIEIATRSLACLLCFEREHACCHRAIVAEVMADQEPFKVRHIGVRKGLAVERKHGHDITRLACAFG